MRKISVSLAMLLAFSLCTSKAQFTAIPLGMPAYPFIHYELNRFDFAANNAAFGKLYARFDTLILKGTGKINIVHIGGSHIQADMYTHRMRQELQAMYPGVLGSRGFFFPYRIAQTNSPSNLKITYTGQWQTCKNTQPEPALRLGLSGITTALLSDTALLSISANYDSLTKYDFNRLRIYCNAASDSCIPTFISETLVNSYTFNKEAQYIQYDLKNYVDNIDVKLFSNDSTHPFELYGLCLDSDDPGITYNAIGVNGAMLKSYLQCGLFAEQLKSLEPDWIIISIGTNEGNTRNFDAIAYRNEYSQMIRVIRTIAPNAALLLTVPNDSYLNKRYINHNTAVMRDIIFELARENACGVWDFYTIMGGLNSVKTWFNYGLMAKDHIHFNKPGYLLKGDLFYNAFMESWSYSHPERSRRMTIQEHE